MNRKQIIDQAKATLVDDRELNAILNRTGFVRVAVMVPTPVTPADEASISSEGPPVVEFSIEEHEMWGERLMAKYNGVKEFAA